jgi:hypothetical protein
MMGLIEQGFLRPAASVKATGENEGADRAGEECEECEGYERDPVVAATF